MTEQAIKIHTEDGHVVHEGDRVYNYYDMKPGVIKPGSVTENGGDLWFDVEQEDGTRAILNGQRICTIEWAKVKGWPGV